MLKLYYCRRFAPEAEADLVSRLPSWRRERLDRLTNESARRSCLAAGLLWRYAMEQNGIDPNRPVRYLPAGKPVFSDGAVFFSLSHSGEYCLCALADKPVGADLEAPRKAPLNVSRRFCPEERQWLLSLPPEQQESALLSLWVKKEAWVKAESRDRILALDEYNVLSPQSPWCFSAPALPEGLYTAVCAYEICPAAEAAAL